MQQLPALCPGRLESLRRPQRMRGQAFFSSAPPMQGQSKSRVWIDMRISEVVSALFLALVLSSPAIAQTAKQRISYDLQMADDRSIAYTKHIETTPLNDAAVHNFAQHRLTVGATQTFEILEAFTRKA